MYNNRMLQEMYQQWQQDNQSYVHRWLDFVEMAARVNGTTADAMMRELQKHRWFEWEGK
jgi:hypothetical protein